MRFKQFNLICMLISAASFINCEAPDLEENFFEDEESEDEESKSPECRKVISFTTQKGSKPKINLCRLDPLAKAARKMANFFEISALDDNFYEPTFSATSSKAQCICESGSGKLEVLGYFNKMYANSICELPFNVLQRLTEQGCLNLEKDFFDKHNLSIYLETGARYDTVSIFISQLLAATKAKFLRKTAFIGMELCGDGTLISRGYADGPWKECRMARSMGFEAIFIPNLHIKSVPKDLKKFVIGIDKITDLSKHKIFDNNPFIKKDFAGGQSATSIIMDNGMVTLLRVTIIPKRQKNIISNIINDGPISSLQLAIKLAKKHINIETCSILIQSSAPMSETGQGFGMQCALEAALQGYSVYPWPMAGALTLDKPSPVNLIEQSSQSAKDLGFTRVVAPWENRHQIAPGLEITVADSVEKFITKKPQNWPEAYKKMG